MADATIHSGIVDEVHPEVFDIRAMPPQPKEKKSGQLSDSKIKQFFEEGYLIVEDFFSKAELDAVRVATENLVEKLAQKLHSAGKIKHLYKEYGLFERLTKIETEFPGANVILHKTGELPQAYRDLWSNDRLLNVIEQLIGPDIASSPVWNLRTKTPRNEATVVPWHQDSAYFDNDSYKVLVPTAWIPLLDTDEFNGGMQVAKGAHSAGKIATHQCCYGGTWYVMLEEEEMVKSLGVDITRDLVTCPIPYGGFLLFNNATPHRSLPNLSKQVRWALDLRWQRPDKPYGLWDMKDGVMMRSSSDPHVKIDWDAFVAVDRTALQKDSVKDLDIECDPEFDTTIQGPWMKKWDIVHMNQHTKRHEQMEMAKQK
ncbi:phytanoyl-CoA dioxygenase-like [Mizuhopecten yessoensis]|uniref:1-deoxypentalenic acid 11-beta-hydroxylase n=1 Tax=Mizuhopecten yessoensis TaxID=6573 RepID=A0A210Q1Q4_MIZYE|nr:phytanoyl-CoA dioxygenase-like [Mizuhopecten yessoensis]OWF42670.1 1-deoxypentalenic acid 11-beta-hydroxylase [Mizuhopecten yessoensis]